MSEALALSINTVAVQAANEVGTSNIIALAKKMGITTLDEKKDQNLAMALGGLTHGVTPLEMASAYGTFANKGVHVKPTAVIKILDRNDNVLEDNSTESKHNENRVLTEKEAYEMTAMLEGVINHGTGTGASIGVPAAGKTGTTDDNKDAWFVGYTPDIVTAVWIGDDTGAETLGEVYGGTIPADIWRTYMSQAIEGSSDFHTPSGMERIRTEEPKREKESTSKSTSTKKESTSERTTEKSDKQTQQQAKQQAARNNKSQ